MSSNRERWHSQLRRIVRTTSRAKCLLWLLAQIHVTVDHASLVYVILFQEGNFVWCLQSLAQIVPWMIALYQTSYHRWLSISVTWWVCWWTIQTFVHSCVLDTLLCTKQGKRFNQWSSIQCHEQDNGRVKISDAQEAWQSLKWQYRLPHLKRIRWPEDQEPNKTSMGFNMKATWVCNLPFSKRPNISQLLFKTWITNCWWNATTFSF